MPSSPLRLPPERGRGKIATVPRHAEINEMTADGIVKQTGIKLK